MSILKLFVFGKKLLSWHELIFNIHQFLFIIFREEIEPIGDGPQYNPDGTADVTADLHNNHLSYSITADDFVREKEKRNKVATTDARQVE